MLIAQIEGYLCLSLIHFTLASGTVPKDLE